VAPLRLLLPFALACAIALAGCTTTASGPSGAAHDDVLHLADVTDPPGLNPLVTDNGRVSYYAPLIHGFLLTTDGAGKLIPDLATEVPTVANGGISRDGRTITYHLRRGARWHDGAAFGSSDVVFSYRAVMNPANNVADRTGFDRVVSISADGPFTVRVRLTHAFSPFVPSFFTLAANEPYPILPAHLLSGKADLNHDPYNSAPVGLGPYVLRSWQRGSRIVLEADPHYFRGEPAIHRIEIAIVPNVNTEQTLWQTGKIDVVIARVQQGRTFFDAVRAVPGTHVALTPHNEFDFLLFNTTHAPLDDVRVRRALVQAIDRDRIMRDLEGELHLAGDTDRLPGSFAYDASIAQPRYDSAAAARALDAAGWRLQGGTRMKDGRALSFDFVAATETPTTGRFGLFVQQDLAKLGIRSAIKSYGYNLLYAPAAEHGIYQDGRFDLTITGWQPNAVADHSYLFRCDMRPPRGDNYGRICDAALDAAARAELTATDPAREEAGDRTIARRLVDRSELLFLGFVQDGVAYRDGLRGVVPSVTGSHLWNAWAWRWKQ
jgi:peptide/nickel transport system substrate-binding protein